MTDPLLSDHARGGAMQEQIERARELAGRVARDPPSIEALDEAMADLGMASGEAWNAWYSTFGEVAGGAPSRRSAWTERLKAQIDAIVSQPDALARFSRERGALRRANEQWRHATAPAEAWSERNGYGVDWELLLPYARLLQGLDLEAWCEFLDHLPSPGVMHVAIELGGLRDDGELLVELLESAPPMFDTQGEWLSSRSVAVLLVAKQVVAHASSRRNVVKRADGELDAETMAWYERAWGTLVRRDDGIPLGIVVLAKLARDDLFRSSYASGDQVAFTQGAVHVLAASLAQRGCTVATIRRAWKRSVERVAKEQKEQKIRARNPRPRPREGARTLVGEGMPFFHGASVMLGEAPAREELLGLWAWLRELLRGRDEGLRLLQSGTALVQDVPQRLGYLLSRLEEPDVRWISAYTELEPLRRRASFGGYDDELPDDRESVLLLRIGLYAAANWARQGAAVFESAHQLFWVVYREARRLWLTVEYDGDRTKRSTVATCFAFMPALFGEGLDHALARALPPIANDAWLLVSAASMLERNGVTPTSLRTRLDVAGASLDVALRDAKQWGAFVDLPARRGGEPIRIEFPPRFAELARAVGVDLDAADPITPTREQLLESFTLAIPWASTLRERMARDGLEIEWLTPQGDHREWLLQASVPTALQVRFGLAPQLRVLAVHGQVRGRMLRRAVQEPRDGEHVDPDLLVIVSDQPRLEDRLPTLAGPWGQRVAWPPVGGEFVPIDGVLAKALPRFDLFDYRDPVRGRALIGRREEIDDISARLARGEAIGVFGLRKVGKSSLLRAVAQRLDPIGARLGMFESLTVPLPTEVEVDALVISLDVQGLADRQLETLAERLVHELEERLRLAGVLEGPGRASDGGLELEVEPLARLSALVRVALERTDLTLCIVLDEYDLLFEGYDGQPGIPGVERLLANLRALGQSTQRVSLGFVGRDPTFLQRPQLGGVTSPLPMRTKAVFLGPLRRDEADELLGRLGRRVGLSVGPKSMARAWHLTGGHPLLLRQLGSVFVEHAASSGGRDTDVLLEEVSAAFLCREMVHSLCSEVETLLRFRYPRAHVVLEALSGRGGREHGGDDASEQQLLSRFGLLVGEEPPWVPEVFRAWFGGGGLVLGRGA